MTEENNEPNWSTFVVPWTIHDREYSWTIKASGKSENVMIIDQDGLVTELTPDSISKISERFAVVLCLLSAKNQCQKNDASGLRSALVEISKSKSKSILKAMMKSDESLSFDQLVAETSLTRGQVEGCLGAITTKVRQYTGIEHYRLWTKVAGRYEIDPGIAAIIAEVLYADSTQDEKPSRPQSLSLDEAPGTRKNIVENIQENHPSACPSSYKLEHSVA